jgi:hypothetical protein
MTLDLTDDEARALTKHLRQAIDYDPYPLALRLDPLKSVLAKLDPPKPKPEPFAAVEARYGTESRARKAGKVVARAYRCV